MMLRKSVSKLLKSIISRDYPKSPSYAYSDVDLDINVMKDKFQSYAIFLRILENSEGVKFCVGTEIGTVYENNKIYSYRINEFIKNNPEMKIRTFKITSNKTAKKFAVEELTSFNMIVI